MTRKGTHRRKANRQRATSAQARRTWRSIVRAATVAIFLIGLLFRLVVFRHEHPEGDELVYRALVENLEAGHGYTLRGHPLLESDGIVKEAYGGPLFFHPPGGVALFWLMDSVFGQPGFPLAQLLSYGVFFWAMLVFAAAVLEPITLLEVILTSSLAAFTPIMTHVVSRFWLDGPLLAFSTAAAALFLFAHRRGNTALACLAGVVLGYACLIKPTAILILPGLLALAGVLKTRDSTTQVFGTSGSTTRDTSRRNPKSATTEHAREDGAARNPWRPLLLHGACLIAVAVCIFAPWEIYQWTIIGNPLAAGNPFSPGRPIARLLEINPYVHYVTVVRSPWIYLTLLPIVVWTALPSFALLVFQWTDQAVRRAGLALTLWIVVVVAVHIGLGFGGYSKLLRYVILITPATVLLFVLVVSRTWEQLRTGAFRRSTERWAWALLIAGLVGIVLEVAQGIKTPVLDNTDLILPLVW